jgi:hypothetical protein
MIYVHVFWQRNNLLAYLPNKRNYSYTALT